MYGSEDARDKSHGENQRRLEENVPCCQLTMKIFDLALAGRETVWGRHYVRKAHRRRG